MICRFWSEIEKNDYQTIEWCKAVNNSCSCCGEESECDYGRYEAEWDEEEE